MKKVLLIALPLFAITAIPVGFSIAKEETTEAPQTTENKTPITEDLIRAYYESVDNAQISEKEVLKKWLQKHIHENADIQININLNIEEFNVKDRIQESFLDKYLLIEDSVANYQHSKTLLTKSEPQEIKINDNLISATVKVNTTTHARSFGDAEKNKPALDITSEGTCTDDLTFTDKTIQLMKRICSIETLAEKVIEK